jgi:hypothetical protein
MCPTRCDGNDKKSDDHHYERDEQSFASWRACRSPADPHARIGLSPVKPVHGSSSFRNAYQRGKQFGGGTGVANLNGILQFRALNLSRTAGFLPPLVRP